MAKKVIPHSSDRGISMSQNKALRPGSSKPHIQHYPFRNVGFLTCPGVLKNGKGIYLYPNTTQKRRALKKGIPASYKGNLNRR